MPYGLNSPDVSALGAFIALILAWDSSCDRTRFAAAAAASFNLVLLQLFLKLGLLESGVEELIVLIMGIGREALAAGRCPGSH